MATDDPQSMFEAACHRLFALHADGYKKPRSRVGRTRPAPDRAAATTGDGRRVPPLPRRVGAV